ncbi:protein phosphatase 2C domain-containing protein [Paracoccaceae bacterium]|nr:protein phosphatase 2C domain-containing protein [Paracoccaceae bacterium]
MIIRYNALTNVGKVRKLNEDSIVALPDQNIWAVSDGMGGHAGGDFASQTVIEQILMVPSDLNARDAMVSVRNSFFEAHTIIRDEADRIGVSTMGATIVAMLIADNHFVAFWAGDSRLYRVRDGSIDMLTSDHSVVAELVHLGELTWDEAENHPQSNAITRAVGVGDELEVDKVRGELETGDRYLLCSDGLTKYATFDILLSAMTGTPIETVSEKLLTIALDGGGADNISIIVIDVI